MAGSNDGGGVLSCLWEDFRNLEGGLAGSGEILDGSLGSLGVLHEPGADISAFQLCGESLDVDEIVVASDGLEVDGLGGESGGNSGGVVLNVSAVVLGESDVAGEGLSGVSIGLEGDEQIEVGSFLPGSLVEKESVPLEEDSGGRSREGLSEGDIELDVVAESLESGDGESSAVDGVSSSWNLGLDVDGPLLKIICLDGVQKVEQELGLSVLSGNSLEADLGGEGGGSAGSQEVGLLSGLFSSLGDPDVDLGVADWASALQIVGGDSDGLEAELVSGWELLGSWSLGSSVSGTGSGTSVSGTGSGTSSGGAGSGTSSGGGSSEVGLVHLEDSSGGGLGGSGGEAQELLDIELEDSDVDGEGGNGFLGTADEEGVLLTLEDVVDGGGVSDDSEEFAGGGGGGGDQLLDGLSIDDSVGVGSLSGPELEVEGGGLLLGEFNEVDVSGLGSAIWGLAEVVGVENELVEVEESVEIRLLGLELSFTGIGSSLVGDLLELGVILGVEERLELGASSLSVGLLLGEVGGLELLLLEELELSVEGGLLDEGLGLEVEVVGVLGNGGAVRQEEEDDEDEEEDDEGDEEDELSVSGDVVTLVLGGELEGEGSENEGVEDEGEGVGGLEEDESGVVVVEVSAASLVDAGEVLGLSWVSDDGGLPDLLEVGGVAGSDSIVTGGGVGHGFDGADVLWLEVGSLDVLGAAAGLVDDLGGEGSEFEDAVVGEVLLDGGVLSEDLSGGTEGDADDDQEEGSGDEVGESVSSGVGEVDSGEEDEGENSSVVEGDLGPAFQS